jgi:TatD DNase family protein
VKLVDTHCHLDDARFTGDRDAVIERARVAGVEFIMTIGTGSGPPDVEVAIRLAEQYQRVYATVGVHPHDASKCESDTLARIAELLDHPKVLALGEIGLDYHYNNSPPELQRDVFAAQLQLASRAQVPVVIHTREAWDDAFELLEGNWTGKASGIMHCFSGGPREAERCLALGFYLSFAGIVTYPKAVEIREAVLLTPLDRLLVETDAPYLAPVPHRGKRNEPAFVVETTRKIADLRGLEMGKLAAQTAENWQRLCLPAARTNG